MSEEISADNSATAVADNPSEPANTVNGTGTNNGQANGAAPADDIFKGIDPNRLAPELKSIYDSMLTDYRGKTSKLSETVKSETEKAVQAYREKATLYDQIAQQEEFVKQWNDYVQKSSNPQPGSNEDPALSSVKKQLQEMNQKIQMTEMQQITDAFAEAVNEKGEKLNPYFDELNTITIGELNENGQKDDFSLLRACIELSQGSNPQERLANGYKKAHEVYNAIFEKGKKAGMGRLKEKISNGTIPPTNSGFEGLTVTDKRPKSAREALEMAKRGQMVSQE